MRRVVAIHRKGAWPEAESRGTVTLGFLDRHRRRVRLHDDDGTPFLGNRHLPMQVAGTTLRIRWDHVIVDMVAGLGAQVTRIDAAFDPEAGAYAEGGHHHHHDDDDHAH
jgi:urease accessory protein